MAEEEKVTKLSELKSVDVHLQQSRAASTNDEALWKGIRLGTEAVSFERYAAFVDWVLCAEPKPAETASSDVKAAYSRMVKSERPAVYGTDAYNLLRTATEVFLLLEAGIVPKNSGENIFEETKGPEDETKYEDYKQELGSYMPGDRLPYISRILDTLTVTDKGWPYCRRDLLLRRTNPSMIELIWSYWHEEGLLVQTMKSITMRFQNRRGPKNIDPLVNLELDPLRPLNNLLWGYIQDEYRRLTVIRRAYEYDHHYGLRLIGKAVPGLEPADSRSKFIEAFHNLLARVAAFYKTDADTTVVSDGFPLLNALRELHQIIAEGAHNQFGDLPWTARVEMLIEQWLLSRPEMREFLRGRYMVPYQEPWMGAVDAMKRLQGWTDTSVSHFSNLAVYGERILLSIRWGDWIDRNLTQDNAKNWAREFRPEIQGYIHAYQAVTGVDLGAEVSEAQARSDRFLQPSMLLQRRLAGGRRAAPLPAPARQLKSEVMANFDLPASAARRMLTYRDE